MSVFWWLELDFFSMMCNEVSSNEIWDVSGLGLTLGRLYIEAQGYVPVLLENLHGMSCSGNCWLLGGAWFQCRYGGFWMSSYWLMFPGARSSLVFSGFELKPPASGFQSYPYISLKTSLSVISSNKSWCRDLKEEVFYINSFWYLEDLTPRKTLVSKKIQYSLEELLQKRTRWVWTLPCRRP